MTCPSILFVIFNRPDTTALVFEGIRQARPARLYVAADGPRPNRGGEAERCEESRRIATEVDWPCEVKTLLRDQNLGCKRSVSSAITWFFKHEEEGIILEDDCLPAPDFFPFCEELLDRYRDDRRIMAICGSSYASKKATFKESYYFSYYADMWGWATWRRAWNLYDLDLTRWAEFKKSGKCASLNNMPPWRFRYWENYFDLTAQGEIETWDYQWIFTVIESGGFACYPAQNLISNLGFRPDATHTKAKNEPGMDRSPACLPLESLEFPLTHPTRVVRTEEKDRQTEVLRLGLRPPPYLWRALHRCLRRIKQVSRLVIDESMIGVIDYLRFPERRAAFGGPFNGQIGRQRLFRAVINSVAPVAIIETGTFRGTTTELMAQTGLPIYSVEGMARNYGFSRARLWRKRNVHLYLGDSREVLRTLFAGKLRVFQGGTVFAYLDAHWNADLPLREELAVIFDHCRAAVVMIDDFQVPDDTGYRYIDYGPGKCLSPAYIEPVLSAYNLEVYYPATRSSQETGARRGCVVLGSRLIHGKSLRELPMLRRQGDASSAVREEVPS